MPKTFKDLLSIGFMFGNSTLGDIIDVNLWFDKMAFSESEALQYQKEAIEDMANSKYAKFCLSRNGKEYTINRKTNMAMHFPLMWMWAQIKYFFTPNSL